MLYANLLAQCIHTYNNNKKYSDAILKTVLILYQMKVSFLHCNTALLVKKHSFSRITLKQTEKKLNDKKETQINFINIEWCNRTKLQQTEM